MGFLGSKIRGRKLSATSGGPPSDLRDITLEYCGGPLELSLQRARTKWVDEIGPARIVWHKHQRLGITFHEKPDGAISIKDITAEGAASTSGVCIGAGQELIGVNGYPTSGMALGGVMHLLSNSKSPCELDFTPPPSPIVVSEVAPSIAARGLCVGHVLVSINGESVLGFSLQQASASIQAARADQPVLLHFSSLQRVLQTEGSIGSSSSDASAKSLRHAACIAAIVAALSV